MLNTTMLRERFVVVEDGDTANPMIALGNRIALPLVTPSRREERLVVRGHNMHTTLRMAAMITRTFFRDGAILARSPSYPWGPNWDDFKPEFENLNKNSWVAVYNAGRCIFKQGEYHPFMDVIEQCDARNRDEYDRALAIAENAFNLAGRGVKIDHNATIAMVIGAMFDKSRVGLIFRNPRRSSTFNFSVEPKMERVTKDRAAAQPHQCLLHAAAWLELVQLSVTAGFYNAKKGGSLTDAPPQDVVQRRLGRLNAELLQFEESFDVQYRPDRPDMLELIEETTAFARGEPRA